MVGMVYNTVNGRARHLVRRTESNKHPGATMAARMTSWPALAVIIKHVTIVIHLSIQPKG